MEKYIGILSGTSMDLVDCAVFTFAKKPKLLHSYAHPFPQALKKNLLSLIACKQVSLETLGTLDTRLGLLFAQSILSLLEKTNLKPTDIQAIGSHGQTIFHFPCPPHPFTLQIGDPNVLAQQTGIPTVADFRRADMAIGGQGAPLAPLFHQAVFQSPDRNRCILNIGGISNLTFLPSDPNLTVVGFDLGPGNTLLDRFYQQHFAQDFDKNSAFANTGKINSALLQTCMADLYFQQPSPKSTGLEYFNLDWLNQKINLAAQKNLKACDIQATLLRLTVEILAQAILKYPADTEIYLCGGGANNTSLIQHLEKCIPQSVYTTTPLGIPPDWVEAGLFAWLAKQTLDGTKVDLGLITGASRPVLLGGVYGQTTLA